jgi:hypothetical protein
VNYSLSVHETRSVPSTGGASNTSLEPVLTEILARLTCSRSKDAPPHQAPLTPRRHFLNHLDVRSSPHDSPPSLHTAALALGRPPSLCRALPSSRHEALSPSALGGRPPHRAARGVLAHFAETGEQRYAQIKEFWARTGRSLVESPSVQRRSICQVRLLLPRAVARGLAIDVRADFGRTPAFANTNCSSGPTRCLQPAQRDQSLRRRPRPWPCSRPCRRRPGPCHHS